MHKPIQLNTIELSFPHKLCLKDFTTQINYGSKIAIVGRNGCGKSSLLRLLFGQFPPTDGVIKIPADVVFGYVPQVIDAFDTLSGGQRFNASLTYALSQNPNVLLLDEPTNHLDLQNRKSLMRLIRNYTGTVIVVSHDTELLRDCVDTLWHVDKAKVHIFSGNYDDYMEEISRQKASVQKEISTLNQQQTRMHEKLMHEQTRAAKSNVRGEKNAQKRKWSAIISGAKSRQAQETTGRKKVAIDEKKQLLSDQLSSLHTPEVIMPKFSISLADISDQVLVQVSDGSVGYAGHKPILENIHFSISGQQRIAITGPNGCGKSTFVKAILGHENIVTKGCWYVPKRQDVGYLDQHYTTLWPTHTVLETIGYLVPYWSHADVRRHLNDFLFRKNEEVNSSVASLSGGEKARLSLAQIAALTPKLLILDEITNNLDLETKGHVVNVLKAYPGAIIFISHDEDFLNEITLTGRYSLSCS
jgi:ATPase subunit of ABC transporter with duplicated ATPase domains